MSVSIYDKALLNKIKSWVKDENMTITGPDETTRLFEYRADINNDEPIQLPLISISRNPTITIDSITKRPLSFDGYRKDADYDKEGIARVSQLNGIPFTVRYNIDIYTRYLEEAEEYVRAFVFNIINLPKLNIEIPYNDSRIVHTSNIRLEPDIDDNSDIPERLVSGQFTRKTISIYIDDAYLFNYQVKEAIKINPDVEIIPKIAIYLEDEIELKNHK